MDMLVALCTSIAPEAKLISIGLVSEDGLSTFYAELSDTWQLADCAPFVRAHVLPHLKGGETLCTAADLVHRLKAWLEALPGKVVLVTDSVAWDWRWVLPLFKTPGTWPVNLIPAPKVIDCQDPVSLDGMSPEWPRHNALADAEALRRCYLASLSPTH